MEIDELTPDEELALVGLLREVIQADGEYTDMERAAVRIVRDGLGAARFDDAIGRAQARFRSRADLKDHARTIGRPEARKLIFDVLEHVARVDGVDQAEEKPLAWLASWWSLD